MSINKTILVGRLTSEPSLSQAANSTIVKFGLATNEMYKGEKQTEFHNIVAFGKTGQLLEQYLNKGDQVYLEGKNKTSSWDKDGVRMFKTEILITSFTFVDGNGAGEHREACNKNSAAGF